MTLLILIGFISIHLTDPPPLDFCIKEIGDRPLIARGDELISCVNEQRGEHVEGYATAKCYEKFKGIWC